MHLEILAEEPSLEAFLRTVLPRVLDEQHSFEIYTFDGKYDLLKKLTDRLSAYAQWMPEDFKIIILVDRDSDNCTDLKSRIVEIVNRSGLVEKSQNPVLWNVTIRIICEELEAWYFGDWEAVRAAYPKVPPNIRSKKRFRQSDSITGGTWEAFEHILQRSSYYTEGLPKIEAARSVAKHFDIQRCDSPSWKAFLNLARNL
jgi:hypothetical protein